MGQQKDPDFSIQKTQPNSLQYHAYYEEKKSGGARLEEAIEQTVDAIVETIDTKGSTSGDYEVFVIVQRGLDIAFFEYHSDRDNLTGENIPNIMGCVSLTHIIPHPLHSLCSSARPID